MRSNLIFELAKRDFTERYAGSVLGIFWAFVWPLVMVVIYSVIFSRIMGAKLPGISSAYSYGIYLMAGIFPWTAFSNTVMRSSSVFIDKRGLISKISMPLPRLPLYVVISETITFIISMGIYFVLLLFAGVYITFPALILIPVVYLTQQIFAYALGFLLATLSVFLRDIKEFVGIIMQLWFWFTPIVYIKTVLPEYALKFLLLNPAFYFIDYYQSVFYYNETPDFRLLVWLTVLGHVTLLAAYLLFKKLEKEVRDIL